MDDLKEQEPVAIEIERDIRIAIWNACCWQGKPQAIAQSFIGKAMEEPTMARALARIAALEAKVKEATDGLRKISVGRRVDYSRIDFTYEPLDEDEAREIATAALAKIKDATDA